MLKKADYHFERKQKLKLLDHWNVIASEIAGSRRKTKTALMYWSYNIERKYFFKLAQHRDESIIERIHNNRALRCYKKLV
eukprot:UN24224